MSSRLHCLSATETSAKISHLYEQNKILPKMMTQTASVLDNKKQQLLVARNPGPMVWIRLLESSDT